MLMNIFAFIIQFESFTHVAYFDRAQYTHGYGTKSSEPLCVTKQHAEQEAVEAIKKHLQIVNQLPSLNDSQKTALTSFSYNVGDGAFRQSKLYKLISLGHVCEAKDEFSKWVYQSGRKLKGLVKRRAAEKALFLDGLKC